MRNLFGAALGLAVLFAADLPAKAQCTIPWSGVRLGRIVGSSPAQVGMFNAIVKKKPIVADVVCETTSVTPWGTFTQNFTDKFWRNKAGDIREDTAYNTTTIRTWDADYESIYLDHESKTARIDRGSGMGIMPLVSPAPSVTGQPLTGVIAGRTVAGLQTGLTLLPICAGTDEYWVAADLELLVMERWECKKEGWVAGQEIRNIEQREPDPALFKIPAGYAVFTCGQPPGEQTKHCSQKKPR